MCFCGSLCPVVERHLKDVRQRKEMQADDNRDCNRDPEPKAAACQQRRTKRYQAAFDSKYDSKELPARFPLAAATGSSTVGILLEATIRTTQRTSSTMVITDAVGIDQSGRPAQLASAAMHHQPPKTVRIAAPPIMPRIRAFDMPSPYERLHQKSIARCCFSTHASIGVA
jgi:hypothetical protein